MLRTSSGRQEHVFEKLGPNTRVLIGEELSVKYPGWLYIPGTVVANEQGNDNIAVKFETTAGPEIRHYPRDSSTNIQRHWAVNFERVDLTTKFTAGERLRVVMPDGESFEATVAHVSRNIDVSHSLTMNKLDGTTETRPLKRDNSIKICRFAAPVLRQQPAPMVHALQTATVQSPSLISLASAAEERETEEADVKRVKATSPSNAPK